MSGLFGSTTIKGTRITDFAQTSANVGQPIPFLYGRAPVNGNVIFAALPPKETRNVQRQGKGGVKQETFTYSTSYAIAFCRGPILGYWWIKRNGKVVYSQDPNAPIEDQAYAAKWAAKVMMYNGTMDQLPNSTIESYKGSGRVSAFRGLSYVVLPNEDVTEGGGAIPSYEAVPIAAPAEVWITSKPYAQIARDSVNTGARLAELTLLDFLKTATASGSEAVPTFRPTSGALFEVAPPEHNDFAAAQFVPAGGELKPPPTGAFKDSAIPSFEPTSGSLAVPPLGTVQKDEAVPSFAPTGGELTTTVIPPAGGGILAKLTSFWSMDETSGSRQDSIGSNHLSVSGSVSTADGVRGSGDTAAAFTGSGALVASDSASLSIPGGGAHCLFGWVKVASNSGTQFMAAKWDAAGAASLEYAISLQGGTVYGQNGGSAYSNAAVSPPAAGSWMFQILWRDPADGKVRMQLNNGAVAVSSSASNPSDTSTPFAFGQAGSNSIGRATMTMQRWGWIKGDILTAEEREWLYNSGQGRTLAELQAAATP